MVLILLNSKLLFKKYEVSMYRVIGAVNVYLLMALTGVSALEIIQLTTEYSITGDVGRWEKIKILSPIYILVWHP